MQKNSISCRLEEMMASILALAGENARFLVTLSGGADSVALLVAAKNIGAEIVAAHCNFHLRGDESDRDQRFVEELCARLDVDLKVTHFDVRAYRDLNGGSMEMACRELRYEWFEKLIGELECDRILTAHHADDNVETMFLNMIRGCGLEGAKAMVADTGVIMRPLLRVHRREIEEYLMRRGETWIVDSTNLSAEPDRNFLRLEILPLLESRFPGARQRLARTQGLLGQAWDVYADWRRGLDPDVLVIESLKTAVAPDAMLHEWLKGYAFTGSQHQEMMKAAYSRRAGNPFWTDTSGSWVIVLDNVAFRRYSADSPEMDFNCTEMPLDDETAVMAVRGNKDRFRAYLPHHISRYLIRCILPGDRMPIGRGKTKKVSDVMKEGGIPLPWRGRWPLVVDKASGFVIWVPGVRRSASELVKDTDKHCYRVDAGIIKSIRE